MAVSKMRFISMIGDIKNADEVVNICGASGVFQPDNVFSFYSDTQKLVPFSEDNPYSEPIQTLKNIIGSIHRKPFDVDINEFRTSRSQIERYVKKFSGAISEMVDNKRKFYKEIELIGKEVETLKHFYGLEKRISDITDCEYIVAKFGKIPIAAYEKIDTLVEKGKKQGVEILFFPFKSDAEFQWGIYFADIEHQKDIDMLFSSAYFEEVNITHCERTPYEQNVYLENRKQELYKKIELIDKDITEYWESHKNQCMKIYCKLKQLNTYFEIKPYMAKYGQSFILVGWVPEEDINLFVENIKKINNLEYSTEKGENMLEHLPPVKLKNKKIFSPFEFFINTYGMPSYSEPDPTIFVALTYQLLFGIMFADLGQGLLVSLVGYIMWKIKGMKLGKALIPCGLFSAIFGTLFGSVFGFEHALDPFYKSVFGLKEKPIEVMDSNTTNYIIYLSVALGVGLLLIAMCLGIYSSFKQRNYGKALFSSTGLCGFIFYFAVVFMAVDFLILHSGVVNVFYIALFIILPLILLMFGEILSKIVEGRKDWKPENWVDYILQNFFELFEIVLSYVTNTMSFLRVGAFVLVHAGMMMVVFTLAEMFSSAYIPIVILGNIIVAVLEALLAGIQVLRLEFYEMFSKFFEGQGRPYEPIRISKDLN